MNLSILEVDRQLLPLKIGSNFESTNVIRVVRFSPLDAQRGLSKVPLAQKVKGTALANFGAFFKKGWRANDIMMGRFDAVCLLTECLLTKERLAAMAQARRAPGGTPYTVPTGMVARCLPRAKDVLEIERVINEYFAATTPSKDAWETMINLIVEAAQEQIAAEEWPRVAQCTLEQHYDWGQYKEEDAVPSGVGLPKKWTPGKVTPDALLIRVAAEKLSKRHVAAVCGIGGDDVLERGAIHRVTRRTFAGNDATGKVAGRFCPEEHREAVKRSMMFRTGLDWIPSFFTG